MKSEFLSEKRPGFVRIGSMRDIKAVILAGVIAETIFELYARFVSPILFDQVLQPSNLVIAIARMRSVSICPMELRLPCVGLSVRSVSPRAFI